MIRIVLCLTLGLGLTIASFATEQKSPRSGEDVYRTYCGSCHGGGWQGAPVAYDKVDWTPRMEKGIEAMLKVAKQGMNTMPPMGTCMDCSDDELRASIQEMLRF